MSKLRALTDACVHCGFCLPACPTYQLDDNDGPHGWVRPNEMDSPRGRIHLVRQLLDIRQSPDGGAEGSEGRTGATAEQRSALVVSVRRHLDTCLGCLACVPACPSGVAYDRIIAEARIMVEPARGPIDRLRRAAIFALFPYPRRLAALRGPLWLAQRMRLDRLVARLAPSTEDDSDASAGRGVRGLRLITGTVGSMARLAPTVRPRTRLPALVPATSPRRGVVGLLTGCVQSVFYSEVSAATARVLAAEGYDVVVPRGQSCCGALAAHTGRAEQARRQARATIALFDESGVDVVVTDVAGCGSAMKEYGHLLRDDPVWGPRAAALAARVRDVTEVLAATEPVAPRHPVPLTVAYHDACHLSHGQGVRSQPRALLAGIPGLRLVPIPPTEADVCCGSAGVYNLLQPGPAARLGARKAAAIRSTGADVVVTGNPGCLLQIRTALAADGGPPLPVRHTVELLDASLAGRSLT
ncbi:MAG: 4Fe-4S dicluster domain-containing protein [Micromonosporaceae bacterium]|nr:4Fe-4S dicluster domain-containing protein [Micromonosporaceae bacterium]